MHFLFGLLFFVLCILLTFAYLFFFSLIPPILQRFWLRLTSDNSDRKDIREPILWPFVQERSKVFKLVVVTVIAFHLGFYVQQRITWMGDDNANFVAKEYFVAGQVVNGIRIAATTFLNPDNPLLTPYNRLQQAIFDRGSKLLPEQDGELGVWIDLWFNYPYIRCYYEPYGTSDTDPSYRMRDLLDRIYNSVEVMSMYPYADPEMESRNYHLNVPRALYYFFLKSGFYDDRRLGSNRRLLQKEDFMVRLALAYGWLKTLRERWVSVGRYETIKQELPKVEVTRQVVAIYVLNDLILAPVFREGFGCQGGYVDDYLEARKEFADPISPNYVWGRFHSDQKEQAETAYALAIDNINSSFNKYALSRFCGVEVAGEERFYGRMHKEYKRKNIEYNLKRYFQVEMELLMGRGAINGK